MLIMSFGWLVTWLGLSMRQFSYFYSELAEASVESNSVKCWSKIRISLIPGSSFAWSRLILYVLYITLRRYWHLHGSCVGCSSHLLRFNILSAVICSLRLTRFLSLTPLANPPVLNYQNPLKLPLFELYLQHVRDHRVSRQSAPLTM